MNPIGRDLKLLRTQKKLSLEEVHRLTKIPMNRLEGIEDGKTFVEFEKEPTVLRSFIRSYGKALGIADEQVVQALDLDQAGRYTQELIEWAEKNSSRKSKKSAANKSTSTTSLFEQPSFEETPTSFHPALPNVAPDAPAVEQIDWAGKKISNIRVGHPKLILYIVIALFSLIIIAGAVWGVSRLFSGGDQDPVEQSDTNANSTDSAEDTTESSVNTSSTSATRVSTQPFDSRNVSNTTTSQNSTPSSDSGSISEATAQSDPAANSPSQGQTDPIAISQPPAQDNSTESSVQDASYQTESESDLNSDPEPQSSPFEVLIYAANGPVGALQFSVDDNRDRRNVRLAQGEAFRVLPNQEIRFDGTFSSMIVFINGEPIDNFQDLFYDRRLRQVVLTRDLIDGLTNPNPRDLLLPSGVNPPSSIRELP